MNRRLTRGRWKLLKIFPNIFLCLSAIFFLSACGSGKSSGFGNTGSDVSEPPAQKRWDSRKIIQMKPSTGILTPWLKASPGKAGNVHISYFDGNSPNYEVNYLVFNSKSPGPVDKRVVIAADNSSGLSLDVDAGGVPVIAYQAGEVREAGSPKQSDAMFSIMESGWAEYTAGIGFVARNPVFKDGLAGSDLSVAFDGNGDIHMVYQFRYEGIDALNYANPDLLYVKKSRGGLSDIVPEETVEGNIFNANGTANAQNNVGAFCTVSIDADGQPVVFYSYSDNHNIRGLKVAYRENGKWVSGWVEEGIEIGGISRARLDGNGNLWIAYFVKESLDGEKNYLRYARRQSPFKWVSGTVEDSIQCGRYPSLSFDSSGNPAIAYYAEQTYTDRKLNDLRFSRFDGTLWKHEYVAVDGDTGLYNSLWFNEAGLPVIVTYSRSDGAIMMYTGLTR